MPWEGLNPAELGSRLRIAREAAGMPQAAAADGIDIARTTLVAIEQGRRRLRTNELQQLARLYGTSVNALLRREAVFVDIVPQFRKLGSSGEEDSIEAAQILSDLARAEVELENVLGIARVHNYPPERPLLSGSESGQAEQDAAELRQWLGLGSAPIRDIVAILELDLGIRMYVRPIGSAVSGLFSFHEAVGACILLNANHPLERRVQTAAHQLGHFVSNRHRAAVRRTAGPGKSREERYADAFGRAFLTPARAVKQRFSEITAGSSQLTRRHIVLLAHAFGVSREALVRRLEDLGLAKPGSWDWFTVNGGITNVQAQQVLGDLVPFDPHAAGASRPTTLRLNLLAEQAWQRGLLSEGQLAQLLCLGRVELRKVLDEIETGGTVLHGLSR